MTLIDLAERCELAEGPSWNLDQDIGIAMFVLKHGAEVPGLRGCCQPEYTASLDAAMTLVPNGWFRSYNDIGADGLSLFTLFAPDMPNHVGIAKTLPLCICAAALRARHAVATRGL